MADKKYKINFEMTDGTTQSVEFTAPQGDKGDKGDKGDTGATGATGATGPAGANGKDGENYVLTDADIQEIAEQVENATIVQAPTFVDDKDKMTDKSKVYVLESTGTIWAFKNGGTSIQTVTEQIKGTTDNPWGSGRLGSTGTVSPQDGYVVTPYIDLTKYSTPFELHLEGIEFSYEHANTTYLTNAQFATDKAFIKRMDTHKDGFTTYWVNATFTDNGDGTCKVTFTPPVTNKTDGRTVGYVRFTGKGTEANANVYVTYEAEVSGAMAWCDTGVKYSGENIPTIEEFTLANPAVKAFMETADYNDSDYSYTQVTDYAGSDYYRKDQPFPVILAWERNANAVQYTVSINTLAGVLNTGMQTYYTKDNHIDIWNLIPNKTYYYKVYALCADCSTALVKSGSFTTTAVQTRMLNIDGIQNVRDIGGYPGLNSKKVKYGLLYRGSAMDESIVQTTHITDAGAQEMIARVGIKTDVDLRAGSTESALGDGVYLLKTTTGYESYSAAITNETQKANFKALLESIVTQLVGGKPAYIHCSGGSDRTGTFVFLLLGLLGVSESDLAKEYELSSLSITGKKTRTRNSTVYDYKGMVVAIKAYSGTTITDKFVSFATECGVSNDTVASFRNLMLE